MITKEVSYEIKEEKYDGYVKDNGLKITNNPIALEIKSKYYMVFKKVNI